MLARRILTHVQRNPMEALPKIVFEHEVPLLSIIHGEGNVRVVFETPDGLNKDIKASLGKAETIDPHAEWGRLATVYGNHPQYNLPVVEYFFQNRKQNLIDFNLGEYLQSIAAGSTGEAAELLDDPNPPSDDDETTTVDTEEIKRRLKLLNVKVQGVSKPETLDAKLREALEERLELLGIEFSPDESTEALWQRNPATQPVGG